MVTLLSQPNRSIGGPVIQRTALTAGDGSDGIVITEKDFVVVGTRSDLKRWLGSHRLWSVTSEVTQDVYVIVKPVPGGAKRLKNLFSELAIRGVDAALCEGAGSEISEKLSKPKQSTAKNDSRNTLKQVTDPRYIVVFKADPKHGGKRFDAGAQLVHGPEAYIDEQLMTTSEWAWKKIFG